MDDNRSRGDDSLLDPQYMGGLEGGQGHEFQTALVVSRIPEWLTDTKVHSVFQEGWSDIEVLFTDDTRELYQVKNTRLELSDLREVLKQFTQRENGPSASLYTKYVVICREATRSVLSLKRALDRIRSTSAYTDEERAPALETLSHLIQKHKLTEFSSILEKKVSIDMRLGWLELENCAQAVQFQLLSEYALPLDKANVAYLEILSLVKSKRGAALEMAEVREILERKRVEATPERVSTFILVSEAFLDQFENMPTTSDFYQGSVPTWGDLVAERDILRELQRTILDQIAQEESPRLLVPILAGGGEGKSTFLMRFAVELARSGEQVLFLRPEARSASSADLQAVLVSSASRAFVLIDNASRLEGLEGFVHSVASLPLETKLVIVLACRTYEWQSISNVARSGFSVVYGEASQIHTLSVLTREEISSLLDKLAVAGVINPVLAGNLDTVIDHFLRTTKGKMLPLVLELAHGKKVEAVIQDELERIREKGAHLLQAYRYICLCATLHSSVTEGLLRRLTDHDDIVFELLSTLRGLVEKHGKRLCPRHERIGELVTEQLYAGNDDALGDDVCSLLNGIVEHGESDMLEDIVRWSFPVPSSQLFRTANSIIEAAFALGRPDLVKLTFDILLEDFDNNDVAQEVLAVRTPWVLDVLVFRFRQLQVRIDFKKIGLTIDRPFVWPPPERTPSVELPALSEDQAFENALKWAELYEFAADALHHTRFTDFLGGIVVLLYGLLAEADEGRKAECYCRLADFYRHDLADEIACEAYAQALEADESYAPAHVGLAASLYVAGDKTSALVHYRKAAELDRNAIYSDWLGEGLLEELLAYMDEYEELIELLKGRTRNNAHFVDGVHKEFAKLVPILRLRKPTTEEERRDFDFYADFDNRRPASLEDVEAHCAQLDELKTYLSSLSREERIAFFRRKIDRWPFYGESVQDGKAKGESSMERE